MANEGATQFGAIKAVLTLDKSDYERGLREAGAQADELGRHDPKIHIDVNAAEVIAKLNAIEAADDRLRAARERTILAETRLAEVRNKDGVSASRLAAATVELSRAQRAEADTLARVTAETERAQEAEARRLQGLSDGNDKADRSAKNARRSTSALLDVIVLLGPAIVPLAAGATALGAAFGGMGVAGVLAIVGIKREMEQGTDLGLTYKGTVDDLTGSFRTLSTVAAKRVLAPFQDAVKDLQDRTPVLSGQIGELATVTGRAGANVASGLLSAFMQLNPLMLDASVYVLQLTSRFDDAMSGPGIVAFGDYIRSVFPQVMQDVEAIVGAAIHLVAALAPLGTGTLAMLRIFSDLISAIPVDVLSTLATLAGSVYLGFRTWEKLNSPIAGLIQHLGGVESMSRRATVAVRGLQVATGIIGIALAALSFIFAANAEATRANEQAVNDYADALRQSNGVIDESIRKMTAKKLADEGALDAGKKLGINLADITDAALGVPGAMDRVNAAIDAHGGALKQVANSGRYAAVVDSELGNAADKLRDSIGLTNGQLDAGIQKNKDLAAATAESAGATSNQAIAVQALASQYGVSAATFQAAQTQQQGIADKAAAATVQMQLENDAAGILKQSLDALNGEALNAAEAQNAFDSSLANMGDHTTATGKKIKFTTTSINDMSSASVALRGQLNGQIANLERVVEANGGLSDSTGKAREQMITMRKQIIDNAVAHGVDRDAVTAYIDKLLKIPKSVPPTKLDVATAEALAKKKALQDSINALKGKTVTLRINEVFAYTKLSAASASAADRATSEMFGRAGSASAAERRANGGRIPGYAGGTIVGPGTGTSDSILAMVAQTGRLLRVSAGEHVSTAASARRNGPALEAGNRGAALTVAGGVSRLHPDDIRAIGKELALAVRQMPRPRVDVDDFSRRLA